jgi:hypothetical protein
MYNLEKFLGISFDSASEQRAEILFFFFFLISLKNTKPQSNT